MLGPEHLMSFMKQHRVAGQFIHLNPEEAKTSESAAKSVGCPISQIAKSIVLLGSRPYVLVVSGDKKVDLKKFSKLVGEDVRLAKPDEVLAATGYPVGGVPPFGHITQLKTYVDASLTRYDEVITSGGSDDTLLRMKVKTLLEIVGGELVDVSK
jgi:Cys-tRNA(Pro) deacylase